MLSDARAIIELWESWEEIAKEESKQLYQI